VTGARPLSHGLTGGESAIMDLWDSGIRDYVEIAARTGYGPTYVEQVVGRYSISDQSLTSFDRMSSAGSALLLEALNRFHPETLRRVHP
jgi:hypothetical protein